MRTATTTTGSSHSRSCSEDAHGANGPVWDWLRIGFCRERVFRAVASIGAGKWHQKKEQALVPGVNYLGGSRQLRRRVAPLSPPAIAGGGDTES